MRDVAYTLSSHVWWEGSSGVFKKHEPTSCPNLSVSHCLSPRNLSKPVWQARQWQGEAMQVGSEEDGRRICLIYVFSNILTCSHSSHSAYTVGGRDWAGCIKGRLMTPKGGECGTLKQTSEWPQLAKRSRTLQRFKAAFCLSYRSFMPSAVFFFMLYRRSLDSDMSHWLYHRCTFVPQRVRCQRCMWLKKKKKKLQIKFWCWRHQLGPKVCIKRGRQLCLDKDLEFPGSTLGKVALIYGNICMTVVVLVIVQGNLKRLVRKRFHIERGAKKIKKCKSILCKSILCDFAVPTPKVIS